ncbi:MAG: TVP38/TMEM64 family protein [Clostridia bacterium]|nr:TVP38/TMEM64 family protein [Clostridia bacterium]
MKFKKQIKIIVITLMLSVIIFVLFKTNIITGINLNAIGEFINSYGNYGAFIFIFIFAARTLLVIFPFSVMLIVGGNIFGPAYGFLFSMISIFISSNIAFFISKYLGKESIQKLLKGKGEKLDLKIEEHGFKIIFLMRISCLFPFDILNFALGLTKVRYKDFILGTILGIIPETFSLTYLGDNLKNPFSKNFIISILLVLITVAIPIVFNRIKNKKNSE